MVTFEVSQVPPTYLDYWTTTTKGAIEHVLGTPVEASSNPSQKVIKPYGFNTLIETIHRAFDGHHHLVLRPDDIWLAIAQGLAACINQDPEKYRGHFGDHGGQKEIRIYRTFSPGNPDNDWQGCFPEFSDCIRQYIGDETHGLILCDFSTTGDVDKAASEVVLMDVVQSYFKYSVATLCGIPSITLEGTVEDWEKVATKARRLSKFDGLEWWLNKVFEVVDQFAAAARGEVDLEWWENLYKGEDQSGGIHAMGHILKLVPFVKYSDGTTEANPVVTGKNDWGIPTSILPQALSCVPFTWDLSGRQFEYQFLAGHVGIAHDRETDSLRPVTGWAVRPKPQK